MDPEIIKYYRYLLRNGFEYTGSMENPSIFLDTVGENLPICGRIGRDYLHLYIQVQDDIIQDIKYLCTCEPTANVVFEILCQLIKGQTLNDAVALTPEAFLQKLKATEPDFLKKASKVLELLKRGVARYRQSLSGSSGSPLN